MKLLFPPPVRPALIAEGDEVSPARCALRELVVAFDPAANIRAHDAISRCRQRNVEPMVLAAGRRTVASLAAYGIARLQLGAQSAHEIDGSVFDFGSARLQPSVMGTPVLYDPRLPDQEVRPLHGIARLGDERPAEHSHWAVAALRRVLEMGHDPDVAEADRIAPVRDYVREELRQRGELPGTSVVAASGEP
jgi:hypothetical protein